MLGQSLLGLAWYSSSYCNPTRPPAKILSFLVPWGYIIAKIRKRRLKGQEAISSIATTGEKLPT